MANKIIKNFFPQDTRIAELYGGIGFLSIGVLALFDSINIGPLLLIHPLPFWIVIFTAFGLIQIWSVALYTVADVVRIMMCLINGSLWSWLSLIGYGELTPTDSSAWLLGIGNLYAFVINVAFLHKKWN